MTCRPADPVRDRERMTAYRTATIDWDRSTNGELFYLHGPTGVEYVKPDHTYRSTGATSARKKPAIAVANWVKRTPPPGWRYGQKQLPRQRGQLTMLDAGPWYNGTGSASVQTQCSCSAIVYVRYKDWVGDQWSASLQERCDICAHQHHKISHTEKMGKARTR